MKINYIINSHEKIEEAQLFSLFDSVGWESANDVHRLQIAFQNSSHVVTAWDGQNLVGIIRSMDDNTWSATIDCLVVHKDYQSEGVGSSLLSKLLDQLQHITYISVSPNDSICNSFYQKKGFEIINGSSLLQIKNSA